VPCITSKFSEKVYDRAKEAHRFYKSQLPPVNNPPLISSEVFINVAVSLIIGLKKILFFIYSLQLNYILIIVSSVFATVSLYGGWVIIVFIIVLPEIEYV
jgi:hypothetical protein